VHKFQTLLGQCAKDAMCRVHKLEQTLCNVCKSVIPAISNPNANGFGCVSTAFNMESDLALILAYENTPTDISQSSLYMQQDSTVRFAFEMHLSQEFDSVPLMEEYLNGSPLSYYDFGVTKLRLTSPCLCTAKHELINQRDILGQVQTFVGEIYNIGERFSMPFCQMSKMTDMETGDNALHVYEYNLVCCNPFPYISIVKKLMKIHCFHHLKYLNVGQLPNCSLPNSEINIGAEEDDFGFDPAIFLEYIV